MAKSTRQQREQETRRALDLSQLIELLMETAAGCVSDQRLTEAERELWIRQGQIFSSSVAELVKELEDHEHAHVRDYRLNKLFEALGSAASMLRLEIDTLQGACLAGREIDLARLQSAFEMLRKLLPTSVTETAPVASDDDDGSARRALLEIIENYAAANEAAATSAMEREEAVQAADAMAEPPPPPPVEPPPPKGGAKVVRLRQEPPAKQPTAHELWCRDYYGGGADRPLPPPGSRGSPRDW
jgi:hypothetical protein